ncbi:MULTISPECIES: nucleotidyl transferase AbiEii/AbiGii toxin family protein [unclassified Thioalkalivibrio]|uniref:nucleotidyl transferase AbiEii/AbiGii toxin family protein n=1 Tax=unclassified Thioalkalivibrio TaxID=2621013 RepID=UPI000379B435|nr:MULTISPECIES: nucleotidyl transferase AbiEii/AbiGii toxin family protein [unclassified Thioalkalivibrio]
MGRNAKPTHWTQKEKLELGQRLQSYVLEALARVTQWSPDDVAFQGGTALHMGHQSPRRSEDLDFLISQDLVGNSLVETMRKVRRRVEAAFVAEDASAQVEMKEKVGREGNPLELFEFKYSVAGRLGKAMTKVEYWPAEREKVQEYNAQVRPLARPDGHSTPFPVADTDSILADKLFALTARPRTKYRDVHDIAWLVHESRDRATLTESLSQDSMVERYFVSASLYSKADWTAQDLLDTAREHQRGMEAFARADVDEHVQGAKDELEAFLPEHYSPSDVDALARSWVENTQKAASAFAANLGRALEEDAKARALCETLLSSKPELAPEPPRPRRMGP